MVKEKRLSPKEIMEKLSELTGKVAPKERKRLDDIERWAKSKTLGELTARKYVLLFLNQLVLDIEAWLEIESLSAAEKSEALKGMSPTLRYWYSELLPQWLRKYDPKFYKWKRSLMKGEYPDADRELIKALINQISSRQGDGVSRLIADLSMATDIIVSNNQENPLCTQLTQSADEYTQEKEVNWEETLRYWGIERGLFISYNPALEDYVTQVVNVAKYNSDNIKPEKYQKFRIEKRRKQKVK